MVAEPVVIVTANMGGFDRPHGQVAQDIPVDWRYYTDESLLDCPAPWRVFPWPKTADPRLAAKWFKMMPPVVERYVIWIDASMEITAPEFAREVISDTWPTGVAVFDHPRRDCIYDEHLASVGAEGQNGKYDAVQLAAQMAHYAGEGYPRHAGLYACGVVAWDFAHPGIADLGADWMSECARWSIQDQLSFPVVCARHNVTPATFGFPQIERRYSTSAYLANRWLRIWPHAKEG